MRRNTYDSDSSSSNNSSREDNYDSSNYSETNNSVDSYESNQTILIEINNNENNDNNDNSIEILSENNYITYRFRKLQNSRYNILFNNLNTYSYVKNLEINKNSLNLSKNIKIKNEDLYITNNICNINYDLENEKKKYIENKHEYISKKKIFNLLLESGGAIFGGSIRDYFVHDYGSIFFYDYLNNNFNNSINILYCNKNIHQKTYVERNTIFNDFDIVMNINHFKYFISKIESLDIKYSYVIYNNFKKYIDIVDIDNQIIKYIVFKINIDNPLDILINNYNKYSTCIIKIDIIICKENLSLKNVTENITSNSDFFCNSLFIYNYSLEINKNIAKYLKNPDFNSLYQNDIKKNIDIFFKKKIYISDVIEIIKNQIFNKEAIVLNLKYKPILRKNKILLKGFNIVYKQIYFDEINCNNELCLLCRSDILENDSTIKFKCCNTFFHKTCLSDWINNQEINNCFVCSKYINYEILKYFF
jgi:hypothetical protein